MSTDLLTHPAAAALIWIHLRLGAAVHFHLAGAGAAAHPDILQRTAEPRRLMPFKMGHRNEDIGVHDSTANFSFLNMFLMDGN